MNYNKRKMLSIFIGCVLSSLSYAEPVPADTEPATQTDNVTVSTADPYEGLNRAVFTFNDKIDTYLLKPVARFYNAIMPRPLNQGVHNFFNNLNNLPTIANDILQLHFYQANHDFWRLAINSTIGIGGLFDIAERMDLQPHTNDFGLTLAYWGYKNSNYLVIPFFGPSTPRDTVGWPVDYFAFSVYPYVRPQSTRYELYGLGIVDRRAQLLKFQSVMEEASYDKYIFVRNAYMQRRTYQIEQNQQAGFEGQPREEAVTETSTSTDFETSAGKEEVLPPEDKAVGSINPGPDH